MKTTFLIFLFAAAFTLAGNAQEKVISEQELPKEIQSYITAHFPQETILQAVKDRDGLKTAYEISLKNLTKLEFNNRGEIFEIDGKTKLPESVIPEKLTAYVKSKHPESFIKGWEKDSKKQKIELNNGLELEFDLKGRFLRYDD